MRYTLVFSLSLASAALALGRVGPSAAAAVPALSAVLKDEDACFRYRAAWALGHIGTAEELAEMACFLLSDRASHITAQAIAVDGGILGTHTTR